MCFDLLIIINTFLSVIIVQTKKTYFSNYIGGFKNSNKIGPPSFEILCFHNNNNKPHALSYRKNLQKANIPETRVHHPVITGRLRNVFKTSFVRYERLKELSETACAHWAWLSEWKVYMYFDIFYFDVFVIN